MRDELKNEVNTQDSQPFKKKCSRRKLYTTLGAVLAVLIVVGIGFTVWHEQPSFCGAICHKSMNPYLVNYEQEQGVEGFDKYGNEVSNTNAIMAVIHRENDTTAKSTITCLNCHEPTIAEQASEGLAWITGNYLEPLNEKTLGDLTSWRDSASTTFCANQNCHNYLVGSDGSIDYKRLEQATMDMEFNPHRQYHSAQIDCGTCHKGHRASVQACTSCHQHENEPIPDGWVTWKESTALMEASI